MVVTLRARFQFKGGQAGRDLSCTSCSSNKMYVVCLIAFGCIAFLNICVYINAIANSVV